MNEAVLDCLIRVDEARLTENNKLFAVPEADRKAIYASAEQYYRPTKKPETYKDLIQKCATFVTPLSQHASGCTSQTPRLSQRPVDSLLEEEDERLLAVEYDETKKLIEAEGIANDENSDPTHCYVKEANARVKQRRREEERRTELYCVVSLQGQVGSENAATVQQKGNRTGPYSCTNISNSRIRGPYLTLASQGRHTRYEALHERMPTTRSAQSIRELRQNSEANRSRHYPRPRNLVSASIADVPVDQVLTDGAALRHWRHQMGLP